jgi:hypothetical protein
MPNAGEDYEPYFPFGVFKIGSMELLMMKICSGDPTQGIMTCGDGRSLRPINAQKALPCNPVSSKFMVFNCTPKAIRVACTLYFCSPVKRMLVRVRYCPNFPNSGNHTAAIRIRRAATWKSTRLLYIL